MDGKARKWTVAAVASLLLLGVVGFVQSSSRFEWRSRLVHLKVDGPLRAMSWMDIAYAAAPDFVSQSERSRIARSAATRSYSGIENPRSSNSDVRAGRSIYSAKCATCHGEEGEGGVGPSLADGIFAHGASDWALYRNIVDGVGGMDGFRMPWDSAWQVVAYVRELSAADTAAGPEPAVPAPDVTFSELKRSGLASGEWLTYSGDYSGNRFSPLRDVTASNVEQLEVEWLYQMETPEQRVETTPLVVDGVMYVTEPPASVHALDAATGEELWTYDRSIPDDIPGVYGKINRGAAVLGNTVFMGTLDAHLVAIDATNGTLKWESEIADYQRGYTVTGAPLAVKDKVITGMSGGMHGVRGFIDAYDADSGERVWRFHTVPGPGQEGHASWEGDSWKTGGGATWVTGSYDPELDVVYWGIGNPGPPYDGSDREGDNLFTNSVVALDPDSGRLQWHFQFTPHDVHDWDSAQVPVLVDDQEVDGSSRLLLWANRNGFFYVLDRGTGEFLASHRLGRVTWAERIDSTGRPVLKENVEPSPMGTLVYPGFLGVTNWWPPSYSPETDLFYAPTWKKGNIFYRRDADYREGERFLGGFASSVPGEEPENHITALDPRTGQIVWQRELGGEAWGGTLATAGGLVFVASDRSLRAYHAESGDELWRFRAGGTANAGPITYSVDGEQRIAVAFGRTLVSFGL